MIKPQDYTVTAEEGVKFAEEFAIDIINELDKKFNHQDVLKISEWVSYLATQN